MAANQSALVNWSQYLALRAVAGLIPCFDTDQNLDSAARLGSLYYRLGRRRRARAEENLRLSFPEWPGGRIQAVAEASVQHMFQLFLVDTLVMTRLVSPASWPRHVVAGELRRALDRFITRTPAIVLTGHFGNWELLGHWLAVNGCSITAVARPIDNPLVNRWLLGLRKARGMNIITKWGASGELQAVLEAGGRLGFIADQNAGEGGLFVPFFGRLASSYKSIALLAIRHEVPVIVAGARRMGPHFRYRIDVADYIDPGEWADRPDPVFYITARYNHALERMIRTAPEQYLWVHRRWRSRPKFERSGRAMPSRLREKIESLPWMTPESLARLVAPAGPQNESG